jgi:hypothetical protein
MKLKAKVVGDILCLYTGKFKETVWMIQIEELCPIQFVTYLDNTDGAGCKINCIDIQHAIKKARQYEKDIKACLELDKENV